jgi:hypothetical protein
VIRWTQFVIQDTRFKGEECRHTGACCFVGLQWPSFTNAARGSRNGLIALLIASVFELYFAIKL